MIRLRHLAAINPPTPDFDRLPDDAEIPFVPLEAVRPSGVDASRRKAKVAALTGYTRFLEGDIVVPKITPTFQADRSTIVTDIPGGVAAGTTELHVVRVRPGVDRRYIRYLLSSRIFLHGGAAEMIGVAGQKRVPDEWLRNVAVPVTDLDQQRAIANYLDTETARVDALIAKKRRMVAALAERRSAAISRELWAEHELVRLKFLGIRPTSGNRDHGSFTEVEDGVACLRGLNVKPGHISREGLLTISRESHSQQRATILRAGDLVIVRSGAAGSAAVVPPELDDCNCVDLVVLKRSPRVLPAFLEYAINSREAQEQVSQGTTGAILSHFNAVDAAELHIPLLGLEEQRAVVERLDRLCGGLDRMVQLLGDQTALLNEHRQALITAAVVGDLSIQGAA
jgi:type I restriction enzyme, S subunit